MKVIRKEPKQYFAFKWEGEITEEMELVAHNYDINKLTQSYIRDCMEAYTLVNDVYIVMGYGYMMLLSERQFKEQYEVLK